MNQFASPLIRSARLERPKRTLRELSEEIRALSADRDMPDGVRLRRISECERDQERIVAARESRYRLLGRAVVILVGVGLGYVLPVGLPVLLGAVLLVWILQSARS